MLRLHLNRFDRNATFALIIVMILFATPLVWQQIGASSDYGWRIRQAYEMTERDVYGSLIRLLQSLLPFIGYIFGTVVIATSFYIATTIVVYRTLARELAYRTPRRAVALFFLSLICVVAQPISLSPLLSTKDMIYEWIVLSPHYNPTTLALRPLVLPLTLVAMAVFSSLNAFTWKQVLGVMALIILSTLIKPNWFMAFVPIYGLVVVIAWLRGIDFDRRMVVIGFGLSSLIAVLLTFGVGTPASNSTIVVRFFAYGITPDVVLKMLLSIAFPIYVSVVWHEVARKDYTFLLSWAMLAAAIAQGLLFDEIGLRAGHRNFLWGQSIVGWLLFVLSVRLYIRQTSILWQTAMPTTWTWRIATLLLTLHTITGVLWWFAHYGTKPVMFP